MAITTTEVMAGGMDDAGASPRSNPAEQRTGSRRGVNVWQRAWAVLARPLASPWVAYVSIALLQTKVMWGMWKYKELEAGDTASYFMEGWYWFDTGRNNMAWSPLYTSLLGTLMGITTHAYAILIAQRMLIALTATLLALAVMRRMLPPLLAWGVAAWWAVLPINYDTLYSVHLFSLLPVLLAWVVAVRAPAPWNRGDVLGVFVAATLLVRNELFVATGCWAAVCLVWECRAMRKRRRGEGVPVPGARLAAAYMLPLVGAAGLVGFFYYRSYVKYPELSEVMASKHTVNMGQVYAFGYQQRHPDWTGLAWTDYPELMQREFGQPEPSLTQMLRSNPRAVMAHFLWNVRLTPAGVQVMLFNVTSSEISPDYRDVNYQPHLAHRLSRWAVAVAAVGAALLAWRRRAWRRAWFRPRAAGWLAMECVAMTAVLIIPTQRPRPSYLFAHSLFLMTVIATAVLVIWRWVTGWCPPRLRGRVGRVAGPLVSAAAVVTVFAVAPNGYNPGRGTDGKRLPPPPRPLYDLYDRLLPFEPVIARKDSEWLIGDFGFEMHHFLRHGKAHVFDFSLLAGMGPDETLASYLDRTRINLVYLDVSSALRLSDRQPDLLPEFFREAAGAGWQVLGAGAPPAGRWTPPDRWVLLWKPPAEARTRAIPSGGDYRSVSPLGYGGDFSGWRAVSGIGAVEGPYEPAGNRMVRWGYPPSTRLAVRAGAGAPGGRHRLLLDGLCGIDGQKVTVKVDGNNVAEVPWGPAGKFLQHDVPLVLPAGRHEVELGYAVWQEPSPGSKLAILYRQLEIRPE